MTEGCFVCKVRGFRVVVKNSLRLEGVIKYICTQHSSKEVWQRGQTFKKCTEQFSMSY